MPLLTRLIGPSDPASRTRWARKQKSSQMVPVRRRQRADQTALRRNSATARAAGLRAKGLPAHCRGTIASRANQ